MNHIGIANFIAMFIILRLRVIFGDTETNIESLFEEEELSKYKIQNKLTFCTKEGDSYVIDTSECSKGAWVPEPLNITCACATGLWVISEDFCDQDFLLMAGHDGECFEVNKPIRRFISLRESKHSTNVDTDVGLILGAHLNILQTFNESIHTKDLEPGAYVLRFNSTKQDLYLRHTEGYRKHFWQRCIGTPKYPNLYQMVKADGVTFIDNKNGCKKAQDLDYPMKQFKKSIWNFSPGHSWHPKRGVGRASEVCISTCTEELWRKERQISVSRDGGSISVITTSVPVGNKNKSKPGPTISPPEPLETTTRDVAMTEEFNKLDRDTSKIAYYLKNWNTKRESGPKLPYKEYKYIQYARLILLKTCPEEYVPTGALTDVLRLFRFLVFETLSKSPEHYSEDTSKAADKRILNSLENCYNSAKKMEFLVKGCHRKIKEVVYDGVNVTAILPKSLLTDIDTTDLILETIWKVVLHTHYLCSESFTDNGGDLSTMYIKLQEFFTDPHLMFRWENPGEATNQVYRILFPSLDFSRFVSGINSCVAGAFGVSKYTKWLTRPSSKHQDTKTILDDSMTKHTLKGRSLNGLPTLFGMKGYCINSYDEPLRWSKFNPDINADCIPFANFK